MGQRAQVRARWGGREVEGQALLETNEIVFRSDDARLRVPLADLTRVEARDGWLELGWAEGEVALELGAQAERWARKITNPPSLLDKLGVKPGHRVSVLIGIDDPEFVAQLRERGANVTNQTRRESDLVFFGADERKKLAHRLELLKKHLKPNGAIWVVNEKGQKEFNDNDVREVGIAAGYVDVKVASFSATRTATKFVIPVAKRPKTG